MRSSRTCSTDLRAGLGEVSTSADSGLSSGQVASVLAGRAAGSAARRREGGPGRSWQHGPVDAERTENRLGTPPTERFRRGTWVVDLDGVVWLAGEPLPGVGEAVRHLRQAGIRVLFVTNNAEPTQAELHARLGRAGISVDDRDLLTSAQAAAALVPPSSRALAIGGPGVEEALAARGVDAVCGSAGEELLAQDAFDAVVVGLTHTFDFHQLTVATRAVRAGARLIGTNDDPTHPTPDGLLPGSGALVAAVATASQVEPVLAGKPHPPMVSLIGDRADDVVLVVGDRPATDGRLAERLGVGFALVRSEVLGDGPVRPEPVVTADGLAAVVDGVLG